MAAWRHIFLCGFMGSGKSTHGKKLAAILKYGFADLDEYIQKKENKTISFIFEHEGEAHFRKLESECLNELIASEKNLVISLGGGTVCFNNNIARILQNGVLVYIEMPAAALAERLKKSRQKRPLLSKIKEEDLETFIREKLSEREVYYKQAHLLANGINLNYLQLHQMILDFKAQNTLA